MAGHVDPSLCRPLAWATIPGMPRGIPRVERDVSRRVEAKLDLMIQAQHQLVAALTDLVQQMAHPPLLVSAKGHEAGDMQREAAWAWAAHRAATLAQAEQGAEPTDGVAETAAVPHGTTDRAPPDWDDQVSISAAYGDSFEDPLAGGYDPNSLSAMAAELIDDPEEDEPPPPPDTDSLWSKRLSMHALRLWQPEWGPRPGQAGCLVPSYLMNGRG